jgi:hypothetical protein
MNSPAWNAGFGMHLHPNPNGVESAPPVSPTAIHVESLRDCRAGNVSPRDLLMFTFVQKSSGFDQLNTCNTAIGVRKQGFLHWHENYYYN